MRIENEGYEAVVSWYLYGIVGMALLTVVSPMIVLSVPLVVLCGPIALAWWRGRVEAPGVGRVGRWCLIISSAIVFLTPVVPTIWYLFTVETGAPQGSFWLLMIGTLLSPFLFSTVVYNWRFRNADVDGR